MPIQRSDRDLEDIHRLKVARLVAQHNAEADAAARACREQELATPRRETMAEASRPGPRGPRLTPTERREQRTAQRRAAADADFERRKAFLQDQERGRQRAAQRDTPVAVAWDRAIKRIARILHQEFQR